MTKKRAKRRPYPLCKRLKLTDDSSQHEYSLAVYLSALGSMIRGIRYDSNMDQTEFAKHFGFSQSQLSCLENGGVDVRLSTLIKLALKLDIDVRDLIVTRTEYSREAWRTGAYDIKRKLF